MLRTIRARVSCVLAVSEYKVSASANVVCFLVITGLKPLESVQCGTVSQSCSLLWRLHCTTWLPSLNGERHQTACRMWSQIGWPYSTTTRQSREVRPVGVDYIQELRVVRYQSHLTLHPLVSFAGYLFHITLRPRVTVTHITSKVITVRYLLRLTLHPWSQQSTISFALHHIHRSQS
jgi:hypothetical protein